VCDILTEGEYCYVQAVSDGSVYNGKPLTMAWQSADGILSPKIIVPQPASRTRTLSSSLSTVKPPTTSSSSSSATTDELPRSHTTSFSKLLEVRLVPQSFIGMTELIDPIFTTRCTAVQSAILLSHVIHLSVTLVDHNHIG